jgi:hypothetical protein
MCRSIREFGFKCPVLARSDGEVVDGVTLGTPGSRRHVGGYLLARPAGTTDGKSYTVSSGPLAR